MSDFFYIFAALVTFFIALRNTISNANNALWYMLFFSLICALALAFLIGSFDVLDNLQKSAIRTT